MTLGRLLDPVAPPVCASCRAYAGRSEPLCERCRGALRWLPPEPSFVAGVEVWAPVAYDGAARALISALKFHGAVGLADTMAAQVVAAAPPGWLAGAVLVPVPLHRARQRRRGFNQAGAIAAALAMRTGLAASGGLVRSGRGTTQVGRGRAERALAIDGAVAVRAGAALPERVMLVDDVTTTGATLAACAGALRAAGVRSVRATAYARTPGR